MRIGLEFAGGSQVTGNMPAPASSEAPPGRILHFGGSVRTAGPPRKDREETSGRHSSTCGLRVDLAWPSGLVAELGEWPRGGGARGAHQLLAAGLPRITRFAA